MEPLIFELSHEQHPAPSTQHPAPNFGTMSRTSALPFPRLSEPEVVRHFTKLSQKNFSIDGNFYPLGSCTMKYNPRRNEAAASLPKWSQSHPFQAIDTMQGSLEVMYNLEQYLCHLTGFDAFTLQPLAGAHGESCGLMLIKKYHESRGDLTRNKVIVPDASHGTNPATAGALGWSIITVPSNKRGGVDVEALKKVVGSDTAALMLTNPNTLGLFDENISEITEIIHQAGGQCYYDGANANATVGRCRPADLGFDVAHLNLHKTFSTPHGGGGPGAGPVGVKSHLETYLPAGRIQHSAPSTQHQGRSTQHKVFTITEPTSQSIGRLHPAFGNAGVLMRAYAYTRTLGGEGFRRVSERAVLNANYLRKKLAGAYLIPYDRICQHEFVISLAPERKQYGVRALDVAKRLIDYGIHPPTIYFPLIVSECLMIEPTETESKQTLDQFVDVMLKIKAEIQTQPELLHNAPHHAPVSRLDEVKAVKAPILAA